VRIAISRIVTALLGAAVLVPVGAAPALASADLDYTAETCSLALARTRVEPGASLRNRGLVTASISVPGASRTAIWCRLEVDVEVQASAVADGSTVATAQPVDFEYQGEFLVCTGASYKAPGQGTTELDLGCDLAADVGGVYALPSRHVEHNLGSGLLSPPSVDPGPCVANSAVDGYVGATSVQTSAENAGSGTSRVCVRVANGSTAVGGRFVVNGTTSLPAAVDTNAAACATAPGNTAPGPHPTLAGAIGAPGDPAYVSYSADTYVGGGQVWICVRVAGPAGTYAYRAVLGTSVGVPTITFVPDANTAAGTTGVNTGSESSKCTPDADPATSVAAGVNGQYVWVTNAPRQGAVCVRLQGGVTAGGRIAVDGGSGGPRLGGDMSICDVPVVTQTAPVVVELKRGSGSVPAVCVNVAGVVATYEFTGFVAPTYTWALDA
jgi:hypothetical protein